MRPGHEQNVLFTCSSVRALTLSLSAQRNAILVAQQEEEETVKFYRFSATAVRSKM
jgi:hypothetical protein